MKKSIAFSVLISFFSFLALPVQAAMVGTQDLLQQQQMLAERAQLTELLQRDEVKQQFSAMGVSAADVELRVAALTDAEVQQINQQLATMPAGEGVLGLAVLIFIVFIITDALGATDIFTFVHPIR